MVACTGSFRKFTLKHGVFAIFFPLIATVSMSAVAKDIPIYRWVDKDNVVHYSQNLPDTDNYTQLSTVSSFKLLPKEEKSTEKKSTVTQTQVPSENQESLQDRQFAKNKATFDKNCKAAKMNIRMLTTVEDVMISEETSSGEITNRALTEKEKKEKIKLSNKHVEIYCDDNA